MVGILNTHWRQFHEFSFYSFVGEFSEIYQFIVAGIFLWTLLTICSSLLVLQAEIVERFYWTIKFKLNWKTNNNFYYIWQSKSLFELIPPLCLGSWSFVAIFLICETGERVTTSFEEFDLELRESNWYTFPIDLQRMLIPVMIYTQQPVIIQGYGNTLCTRFALNKVRRFVISPIFSSFFEDPNNNDKKLLSNRQSKEDSLISWCFAKWLINLNSISIRQEIMKLKKRKNNKLIAN